MRFAALPQAAHHSAHAPASGEVITDPAPA